MKTIFSKLEDNIFSGILVKKGENKLTDKECKILFQNRYFCVAAEKDFIFLRFSDAPAKPKEVTTPNFEQMSYYELKDYAKEHDIKPKSQSRAEILKALKGE